MYAYGMSFIYNIARPLLFRMDAEKAHNLTLKALKTGLMPGTSPVESPALEVTLWKRKFPNPVGLAAGFDKNAEVIGPMLKQGFGFVEAGTVTPKPQKGNPLPRIHRHVPSESVINAMGFPNAGVQVFKDNVQKFLDTRPRPHGQIGINIGMNKGQTAPEKDYRILIRHLGPLADYLVVNVSSPNTPGLRDLQKRKYLRPLLSEIMEERDKSCGSAPPPLLLKLAPDLDEQQAGEIAETALNTYIDGLILTNTTLDRPDTLPTDFTAHKGGLSGRPVRQKSTDTVARFYKFTGGRLPIIGLGGISTAEDAYEKIKAGASLVQLYTSLVFRGPSVVKDINTGLIKLLENDGYSSIQDAVGAAHKE